MKLKNTWLKPSRRNFLKAIAAFCSMPLVAICKSAEAKEEGAITDAEISDGVYLAKTTGTHNRYATQFVEIYGGNSPNDPRSPGAQIPAFCPYADIGEHSWCCVKVVDGKGVVFAAETS